MKKLLAIFLFLGIWLQTFYQLVIVAQYYANKDYIAKNLCENRNKPKMHCDGKCCLKKKLAREGKEQAPSPRNQKSEQVVLFFNQPVFELNIAFVNRSSAAYPVVNDTRLATFHHSIFHPPGRLVFA